ncbi:MAG: type II secretion system protein GspJ [Planctomycetota bacterium]
MPGQNRNLRFPRAHGFTLLEVILATVVTAVISAALFASLSVAFGTKRTAEDQVAGRAQLRSAIETIRQDLISVPRPTGLLAGPMIGVDSLIGAGADGDYLAYSTPAVVAVAEPEADSIDSDYEQVVLFLAEDPDDPGYHLLVRSATRNPLTTFEQPGEQRILARRVVSMSLRYYDGTGWTDQWDSTQLEDDLPLAVEVVLVVQPPRRDTGREPSRGELEQDRQAVAVLIPMPASQLESTGTGGTFNLF